MERPSYRKASISNRCINHPTHHLFGAAQSPTSPRAAALPSRHSNSAPRALPAYLISRPHACTADRLASGRENFQGSRLPQQVDMRPEAPRESMNMSGCRIPVACRLLRSIEAQYARLEASSCPISRHTSYKLAGKTKH
jgi:hypothetical protein